MTAGLGRVDYLVGGLRIGLGDTSRAPGPRAHVQGFAGALERHADGVRVFAAAEQPGLRTLAGREEGVGSADPGRLRLAVADGVRLAAAAWSLALVRRWSARDRADVVYERAAVLQYLGGAHARRRSATWVVESNGVFSRETDQDRRALGATRLAATLERRLYRRCDLVVTVSSALGREIAVFAGLPEEKLLVLPNAVPAAALATPVPDRTGRAGRPVIGFAGTVVAWQRVDLLLRACAALPGRFRVEVVGEGTELPRLRALAAELGLEPGVDVKFTGRVPHAEALARMAGWTVGYSGHVASSSASMYHSPLKLYEYAGLGLDVIGTPTDDAAALQECGLRVVPLPVSPTAVDVTAATAAALDLPARTPADVAALRDRLTAAHTWDARVEALAARLAR